MSVPAQPAKRFEGRLRIVIRDSAGVPVAEREVTNIVLRSGAELVAALFTGAVTTPVNGVAVGVNSTDSAPPYEATGLTTTALDGTTVVQQTTSPLDPAKVQTEVLTNDLKVRVSLQSVIGANRAVSPDPQVSSVQIGEAALGVLAQDGNSLAKIYNRVVFEPVPKGRDQEMSLYWEIDFPYGV